MTHSKEPPEHNELREPLEEIQIDFKDIGSISPEPSSQGKRQHVIEVCNFVDAGTSIALWAQAREDFHEQTALEVVITFLRTYGCPHQMTFDRDPRWVGSASGGLLFSRIWTSHLPSQRSVFSTVIRMKMAIFERTRNPTPKSCFTWRPTE